MRQSELDDYQYSGKHPWRNKATLEELYLEKSHSANEIASLLGCSQRTILDWLHEYEIPVRGTSEATTIAMNRLPAKHELINNEGYEAWRHQHDERHYGVLVHRLVAVAKYGFDAVRGMEVHHKNGIRWDNRPENLTILTKEEHMAGHARKLSWLDKLAVAEKYRNTAVTQNALAEEYDVTSSTISKVVHDIGQLTDRKGGGSDGCS